MMNLSQTKLVGLTMELDLKTREYKKLCDKLDELKERKIDPNDERLLVIKELFQKNHDDIVEINRQIKEVKETEELKEKQRLEKNNLNIIFENKNNTGVNNFSQGKSDIQQMQMTEYKENSFIKRIFARIKKFFNK